MSQPADIKKAYAFGYARAKVAVACQLLTEAMDVGGEQCDKELSAALDKAFAAKTLLTIDHLPKETT